MEGHPIRRERVYEYRHVVTLAETNLLGNVYFSHYLSPQGYCREMFLKEKVPSVIDELARDLRLVTLRCSCEYFVELFAFDEVVIRMRLQGITQNRIALGFEYWRSAASAKNSRPAASSRSQACVLPVVALRLRLFPITWSGDPALFLTSDRWSFSRS